MQKIYVITGASSELAIECLKREDQKLSDSEQSLAFCQYFSNKDKLLELSQELKHIKLELTQCDLTDANQLSSWISYIKSFEKVPTHILHLAASKFQYMRLKDFNWDLVSHELNLQVNSIAQLFKAFLPSMAKTKFGKVVLMLTAYTLGVPPKFMSNYVIAKYALLGLLKASASEYSGKGISINALSPNMFESKLLDNLDSKLIEMNAMNSTMKRNASIEEVVSCIEFLLSDNSSYLNGVNLNMTGGDRM